MGGRVPLSVVVVTAALMMCPLAAAGDESAPALAPEARAMGSAAGPAASEPVEPWIHPSMPGCMKEKILAAFQIAVGRVREVPECSELFKELGADGVEMLATTLYFPASPLDRSRCRHSFALTEVGAPTTWVCRKVTAHCDDHVAVALLHEALHYAGLDEDPCNRRAKCSGAINTMVMRSCGF